MAGRGGSWDVFLAYAGADEHRAHALFGALREQGVQVCFAPDALQPGDNWHTLLPQWIEASSTIVALLSADSAEAHFQQSELVLAIRVVREAGGRLVPVRLSPDAWEPYGTEQLHAIEMFTEADVSVVAARIAALVPTRRSGTVFSPRVPAAPKFFTGRDELVAKLGEKLRDSQSVVVTQAIRGLGGVGKTTVAAALAEASDCEIVWWVRAETPALLTADLAELAPHVGAPRLDDPAETAARVRERLETIDRSWLVVFDNVTDQRAVEEWLPRRGGGAVVITSRASSFSLADHVEAVDTLPDDAAEAFLRRRVAGATEDLRPVLDRLRGLPLALEQAAAWVAELPSRTFAQFVARYDKAARDPFPDDTRPTGYDHTVTTTWRVSIEAAKAKAPLAEHVLAVVAFLAPDDLPCEWLRSLDDDPDEIDDALAALHGYSLVTVTPADTLSVHRVVQAVTRRDAPSEAGVAAISLLHEQAPDGVDDLGRWPEWAVLVPHTLAAASSISSPPADSVRELRLVLDGVAHYQQQSGAVREGLATAHVVVDLATAHWSSDDPDVLHSRRLLALGLHATGDYLAALEVMKDVVDGYERVLGQRDRVTLMARGDLAYLHRMTGDLARARELHEDVLHTLERVLGPDHPDTLDDRHHLAGIYWEEGDLDRAIPLYERGVADSERLLGPDHPNTLASQHNLATAYMKAGDLDRAIGLLERTLATTERVLGPDHPSTLRSLYSFGVTYAGTGDLDRAAALLQAAVARGNRALGSDHPDVQHYMQQLATLLAPRETGGGS